MVISMNMCFVCTPPHEGDPNKIAMVKKYCRDAVWDSMIPVAPNLSFAAFLNDDDIADRWRKKTMVMALLPQCKEFRVFCNEVTEDMIPEIKKAQDLKIPVKFFDADLKEIDYDALIINKKIGPGYRKIIAEAHGDYSSGTICPYAAECSRAKEQEVSVEKETASTVPVPDKPDKPDEADLPVVIGEVVKTKPSFWWQLFHGKVRG